MLLTIDIGNTNIVFGIFVHDRCTKVFRIQTDIGRSAREYDVGFTRLLTAHGVNIGNITGVIMASVVPEITNVYHRIMKESIKVPFLTVGLHLKTGITVDIEKPSELGADRLVNAVAAYKKYKGSSIVIDFGTATTFDCISANGAYIGGAIASGPDLSSRALKEHTAQLPFVEMKKPKTAIGKDTVSCIESGLYYGYKGLIQEIIAQLKKEMGVRVSIVATGGLSHFWAQHIKEIQHVSPNLTLEGMHILWRLNNEK